jgi:hypothetical protein
MTWMVFTKTPFQQGSDAAALSSLRPPFAGLVGFSEIRSTLLE